MVYKGIDQKDISYREFFVYKEFILTENDDSLKIRRAIQNTGSYFYTWNETTGSDSSGIFLRTLHDSIRHLYYHEDKYIEYSGSYGYLPASHSYNTIKSTTFYDPYHNFGCNTHNIHKNLNNYAVVISIPQELYGNSIKPKSIHLEDVTLGYTLKDDGFGNLYNNAESSSFSLSKKAYTRGNVFYEHGNVIITATGSDYKSFGTGSNNIIVKFKSTLKIYEIETYCTVKAGEFNFSMNPSARISRSLYISEPLPFVTSSNFSTYITGIGLYDNQGNLLIYGKPSQPIKNDPDLDITFCLRVDF